MCEIVSKFNLSTHTGSPVTCTQLPYSSELEQAAPELDEDSILHRYVSKKFKV